MPAEAVVPFAGGPEGSKEVLLWAGLEAPEPLGQSPRPGLAKEQDQLRSGGVGWGGERQGPGPSCSRFHLHGVQYWGEGSPHRASSGRSPPSCPPRPCPERLTFLCWARQLAGFLVGHALQRGEWCIEATEWARPETAQALAVEVLWALQGSKEPVGGLAWLGQGWGTAQGSGAHARLPALPPPMQYSPAGN